MIYHFKENLKEILFIIIALYKLIIYKNETQFKNRIFFLKSFYEFGSIFKVQRSYCANFNEKIALNHSTIRNIVQCLKKQVRFRQRLQHTKVPARSDKTPKIKAW